MRPLTLLGFVLLLVACGGGLAAEVPEGYYANVDLQFAWKVPADWSVEEREGEVEFVEPGGLRTLTVAVVPWGGEDFPEVADAYLINLQANEPEAKVAVQGFFTVVAGEEAYRIRFNYQDEVGNRAHDLILVAHNGSLYTVTFLSPWDDFQRDAIIGNFLSTLIFL